MRVRVSTEIGCENSGNVAEFWFVLGHLLGSAIGVELLQIAVGNSVIGH